MKIDDLINASFRLKNEGVKEVTIDPNPSKVCEIYGFINLWYSKEELKRKIRIVRK